MQLTRRQWLGTAAVLAAVPTSRLLTTSGNLIVTPERFGAIGDGRTNDTVAFAKMSDFVNHNGGGTIVLRPVTYIVGAQAPDRSNPGYSFAPARIMEFNRCPTTLSIVGNGARLKCADGLRFGTFDANGQPTYHRPPFIQQGELASPYEAMILIQNCAGHVYIENIELDGNLRGLRIGGPFGDTGWQIPCHGLRLWNNIGNEHVTGVHTHHHALDGMLISGVADRQTSSIIDDVTSEYNARQGCSLIGGRNYSFVNSRFSHTGRAGLTSAPGSGVDLESESCPIRQISFSGCEFSNNAGVGIISDVGDTADVSVDKCRIVGTTTWSAWPKMPRFRFTNSVFAGALCNAFASADPRLATQFSNCSFLDDPALSPTGQIYRPGEAAANLALSQNVLFDGCRFDLKAGLILPWSWQAHYNNCTMSQVLSNQSHPKGTYTGVCEITGNAELYGSIVLGHVVLNGRLISRTVVAP